MSTEEIMFFNQWPQLLSLYETLCDKLCAAYPDVKIKVAKTKISFYNRHMFAMASLPVRRRKEWPSSYLMVSFGLGIPIASPRIAAKVEAYPGRWTHHVLIEYEAQLDGELLGWLDEAYRFALAKRGH